MSQLIQPSEVISGGVARPTPASHRLVSVFGHLFHRGTLPQGGDELHAVDDEQGTQNHDERPGAAGGGRVGIVALVGVVHIIWPLLPASHSARVF